MSRTTRSVVGLLVLAVGSVANGALFTVNSASAVTHTTDPGFQTFTSTTGSTLSHSFNLVNVGDFDTFNTLRYFTTETSALQSDDPDLFPTTLTLQFTAPESKPVDITGSTHGGALGSLIPGGGGAFAEAGLVQWDGPVFVLVGGFNLKVEATDTVYNDFLTSFTSGDAFGANVPVTVTLVSGPEPLVPEPSSLVFLIAGAGLLVRRRRV